MRHALRCLLLGSLWIGSGCTPAPPDRPQPAELVFRHGRVYTLDAQRPRAEAVAVAAGRIAYVGPEAGIERWIGPQTRVIDLQGKMLLPGFQDSHTHLVSGGVALGQCQLGELDTPEEIAAEVGRYAAAHPEGPAEVKWIQGGGWQLPVFPGANPAKTLLDRAAPGRAVALYAADGHSLWASSRALELAGITRETPDPPNGRIERDPATGEPTGTLREAAAGVIEKILPATTAEERVQGLRRALELAARNGITSVQDASVDEEILRAYADLAGKGELTVRTVAALRVESSETAEVARLAALREKYRSDRLRPISAKIFADGVIESQTAALLEPYLEKDSPGAKDRGIANWPPEALNPMVAALAREGFQVHVHAIGDRAVRMALDAFEQAGAARTRPQIAHLELIDPQDIPRFRKLGVIANFQPLWAYADPYITELTLPVLGPERSRRLYPIGTVARAGAALACGSDWDVTTMNVLEAIQVAVTRRDPASGPGPAWLPEHLADLATMLACYTTGGAWANFQEKETGSIEVGKLADLVLLDRDLFAIPASEIAKAKVVSTFLGGRSVYEIKSR